MNTKLIFPLFFCLALFGLALYSYVEKQNEVTKLRLELPSIAKEIKALKEKNTQLKYEIESMENPERLMALAREPRFNHLKHPFLADVVTLQEGLALNTEKIPSSSTQPSRGPKISVGTHLPAP